MPKNSSHYHKLRDKWIQKHKTLQGQIFAKHRDSFNWIINNSKELTLSTLVGMLVLTTPVTVKAESILDNNKIEIAKEIEQDVFLTFDLKNVLPKEIRPLNYSENEKVKEVLNRMFKVKVESEISGKKLNTTYGLIGQEQHLARFPGDNMNIHLQTADEINKFSRYGMAPGLGAWGYFANSQAEMSNEEIQKEKYYIAVQTFLAKGFMHDPEGFVNFFKHRKMLVVNPQNGKAVVVVIADAGPAPWTGKHLGGSPEVMQYLERVDGAQKGPVLFYFIEDPENKISLGPISL